MLPVVLGRWCSSCCPEDVPLGMKVDDPGFTKAAVLAGGDGSANPLGWLLLPPEPLTSLMPVLVLCSGLTGRA